MISHSISIAPKMLATCIITFTLLPLVGCSTLGVPNPAVKYIAFGDSTTDSPSKKYYPDYLSKKLGKSRFSVANEGKGGETAADGLPRLQSLLNSYRYPNAEVLLYWEGGNDFQRWLRKTDPLLMTSPEEPTFPHDQSFNKEMSKLSSIIRAAVADARNDGLKVYVATYFYVREDFGLCKASALKVMTPLHARRANAYIRAVNDVIRAAALDAGAHVVDVESIADELAADRKNYYNCNHLSGRGNEKVAELFAEKILTEW